MAIYRVWAGWPPFLTGAGPQEHLQWFADAWGADQTLIWVAEHNGKIAAFSLGYRRPIWVRGRRVSGVLGAYEGVDPEFRRMYLYEWLAAWRRQHDGRDVSFSFSKVEALKRTEARFGGYQQPANQLVVLARVLDPLRASSRTGVEALRRAPGYALLRGRSEFASRRPAPGPWRIHEIDRLDERVDGLEEKAATEFALLPGRGHDFLNWRYFHGRAGAAFGLIAEEGEQMVGYLILRPIKTRTHVADLLVEPGRLDVAHALLTEAVERARASGAGALERARASGAGALECTLPRRHPYHGALRATGFVPLGARSRAMAGMLGVGNQSHDPRLLEFLGSPDARIHLTVGDSDLV